MVKLLLSRGANINAFDKKDRRAIHWAAYMGIYFLNLLLTIYLGEIMHFGFGIYETFLSIAISYIICEVAAQTEQVEVKFYYNSTLDLVYKTE